MVLELGFVKPLIVKGTEFWREAAKGSDQPQLRFDDIYDKTELRCLCEFKAIFGFTLHRLERIARREEVGIEVHTAVRGEHEISDGVRSIETLLQQLTAHSE